MPAAFAINSFRLPAILIDGQCLAELMIEHNIGVSRAYSCEIRRVDSDYFEKGCPTPWKSKQALVGAQTSVGDKLLYPFIRIFEFKIGIPLKVLVDCNR